MTLTDLYNILTSTGLPVAYQAFKAEEGIKPPCITYEVAFSQNFGADNHVYSPFTRVDIFLFEAVKDGSEDLLEDALDANLIFWDKTETWENDEKVYQIIYEVTINGK